jgi:hypothetical protein
VKRGLKKLSDGLCALWVVCLVLPGTNIWVIVLTFPLWVAAWLIFFAWMVVMLPCFAIQNKIATGRWTQRRSVKKLLILVVAIMAVAAGSPDPRRTKLILKSPKDAEAMPSAPMRTSLAPVKSQRFELSWDYPLPMPLSNSAFTVLYAPVVQGPYLPLLETRSSPVVVDVTGYQGYFKIKTHEL